MATRDPQGTRSSAACCRRVRIERKGRIIRVKKEYGCIRNNENQVGRAGVRGEEVRVKAK